MSEPYKHCYSCGAVLEVTPYAWSFNGNTGKPNIAYEYKCPNQPPWYKFSNHPKTSGEAYALEAF